MYAEVFVFNNEDDAQRLKDYEGEAATMLACDQGAEVVGRAGLGFTGYTNQPVWLVTVERTN